MQDMFAATICGNLILATKTSTTCRVIAVGETTISDFSHDGDILNQRRRSIEGYGVAVEAIIISHFSHSDILSLRRRPIMFMRRMWSYDYLEH